MGRMTATTIACFAACLLAAVDGQAEFCAATEYTCGNGQVIRGSSFCNGFNDCSGNGRATATNGRFNVGDDEANCGGLLSQIVGGYIGGLQVGGETCTTNADCPPSFRPCTGGTCGGTGQFNLAESFPEAGGPKIDPVDATYRGIYATVRASGGASKITRQASWNAAAQGSATYLWSFARCKQQGLEMCARNTQDACNYYKEVPITEGAFKVLLEDEGGSFDYKAYAVDPEGNVDRSPNSYQTKYGKPPPLICTGNELTKCLDGSAESVADREQVGCVCGGYSIDTELNADFNFSPPQGFTGIIEFRYQINSYSYNEANGQDNLCTQIGGRTGGSTGCSEQSAGTGLINVRVVVTEGDCVASPNYEGSSYCGPHGKCNMPSGCDCDPGWRGDQCDVERSAAASLNPSIFFVSVLALVSAVYGWTA